jgi:glycosyltransferase involved in cell wall biosynthesis
MISTLFQPGFNKRAAISMRITIVEPYCTGSHAAWAQEYASHSRHDVELLTLPGRHWKWRMHGGAVTLASRFLAAANCPDLILATDMLDLTTFLALTRGASSNCRCALYFHENQLTYPWSPEDPDKGQQRDLHYAFINYASALAADAVLFNSSYHKNAFLGALPGFLKRFPDATEQASVQRIVEKSRVLPLGMDLKKLDRHRPQAQTAPGPPLILWNHRWEFDKAPEAFFEALYQLADEGLDFRVAVLGESFGRAPAVFKQARERLATRVVQWGYLESFDQYAEWLWRADILPVTSRQEFFGASVVQALYCDCAALLPERLSYPEHVPAQAAASVLYRDGEKLVDRLRTLVTERRGAELMGDFVRRYDWENLAPVYDSFLERLAAGENGAVPSVAAI